MERIPGPSRPQGFPPSARLRRSAEYERLRSGATVHDLGALSFRLAPRPAPSVPEAGPPPARLGLVVSRRVGGAVVRNRIKRRVREAFRRRKAELVGLDLVVSARPGAGVLDGKAIDALFDRLLTRLRRPESR